MAALLNVELEVAAHVHGRCCACNHTSRGAANAVAGSAGGLKPTLLTLLEVGFIGIRE